MLVAKAYVYHKWHVELVFQIIVQVEVLQFLQQILQTKLVNVYQINIGILQQVPV